MTGGKSVKEKEKEKEKEGWEWREGVTVTCE